MAHTIITSQHLLNVIGLATDDQENDIIPKRLGTWKEFLQFQPSDIKMLCSLVRKPGGIIEVPNSANLNKTSRIPNPGYNIPALCETSMVLTAYGADIY